ncbi:MAG: hypothetical protein ACREVV_05065 [Steroidobacteraceae bacterium]
MRMPTVVVVAAALLAVAGCHKAGSPSKVQSDVSKAENTAAENDAKANQKQADASASANKDVAETEQKQDTKTADAAADAAVTEAEGRNKIALAKCEALSGRSQQACRDTANAALEMAKAKAKTMKAEHNQ